MRIQKLLLTASAAIALALPQLAQKQAPTPLGTGEDTAASSAHGHLAGRWEKPALFEPGHLRGKLVGPRGGDAFRIEARIERAGPLTHWGQIVGKAIVLEGPHAGRELELAGRWHATGREKGRFQAYVADGNASDQRHPRIELSGRYADGRPARPGHFQGRWSVAP